MHSFTIMKQLILPLVLLFIILFKTGESETGISGTGLGYLPEPGGGDGGHGAVNGGGGDEPEVVIVKAIQCFSNDHIYTSCEESYRLTESGQLHVPPGYTDEYCNGACLKETHLVLNCIDDILSHYVFNNHATINDVKETIEAGCSYGPHRGDFNVAEHIEDDESSAYAYKLSYPILFGLPSLVLVFNLLF